MSEPYTREDEERPSEARSVKKLFDLRLLIGGLFSVYGIVLIIAGLADGKAEIAKATGIRINLWTGLGMLVIGLLFLLWMKLTGDGHDRPEHTAADEVMPEMEPERERVGAGASRGA